MTKCQEADVRVVGANTVDAYKAKIFTEAEKIVLEGFPNRIKELTELLESERYSYNRIHEIGAEFGEMRISLPTISADGSSSPNPENISRNDSNAVLFNDAKLNRHHARTMVPCNRKLDELLKERRVILLKALEEINTVRMWITLLLPKIEDGHNFGVAIQEMILREVKSVESVVSAYLDHNSRYYGARAKGLSKVQKYPHLADYRLALQECDENIFINMRTMILELRNYFAALYDLITKNIEKIRRPRSETNLEHMY